MLELFPRAVCVSEMMEASYDVLLTLQQWTTLLSEAILTASLVTDDH